MSLDTFRWFSSANQEMNRILDESLSELTTNLFKYKDYDYIFTINENDTKNMLLNWQMEDAEEEDDGPKGKKVELTPAQIKEKFKKNYRNKHCINPSQDYLYKEINKFEELSKKILTINPNNINLGMFKIDHSDLIEMIQIKCNMVLNEI